MNAFDRSSRLQQELPDILTDIAAPRVPDYVDDILAQTAATRQRPRWTFIERWLPMGVIARRPAFFPTVPWRTIVAVAALVALLAAALFVVGSQSRVPPPFGLARNGALVFDAGGDIYVRDAVDGTSRALVTGPTDDFAAGFTRDGTRLVFLRRTAGTEGSADERIQLFIANTDGSNPRELTGSFIAPDWFDWSPDDAMVVTQADGTSAHLYVADIKAGTSRQLDLGVDMLSATFPNFLGPDGREVVFRGRLLTQTLGSKSGIFAVRPDGTGLRPLSLTDGDIDGGYQFPQPSPDGRYLAYTVWDSTAERNRMHLLDLTGGADRTLDLSGGESEGFATFSPDSNRIIFVTYANNRNRIKVAPVDGSSKPLAMGPSYPIVAGKYLSGIFSPDGKSVIVNDSATKETRFVDAATGGDGQVLPWAADGGTAWQRLAP
jgi:Tol biopolymer transport system component